MSAMHMIEVQDRLEQIRTILHTFKTEQEKIILKSNDEYKFRLNSLTTSPVKGQRLVPATPSKGEAVHTHVQPGENKKDIEDQVNKAMVVEANINKILNHAVVIMPMGMNIMMSQRLWPHALGAQYHHCIARMANIESHGSLWKIVPRKDNHIGTRVVLQSAEIGEEVKYLTSSLELTDLKADAAIWNLRVCDAVVESTPVDLLNADGKGVTKGIPVIFELVDQSNSHLFVQHDASSNLLHSSFGLPSNPHSSLLMCSHSQLTGNSEVQVMTLQKARDLIQENNMEFRAYMWEVCPETWINDDMEFLERFLA